MPLCTMLTYGVEWGWLLTSLGSPWVAQRVCPMPQWAAGRPAAVASSSRARRAVSRPLLLMTRMPPPTDRASPAES